MATIDTVEELREEQAELDAVLISLPDDVWVKATPADGWDVRDQVSHLADTNDIAYDTVSDGPRSLNVEATKFTSPEEFTLSACLRGREMSPAAVLEWWRTSAARTNELLSSKDPAQRVPWGLGMTVRTLGTARLMEHWAHGLDIRAAAGLEPNHSPRLRSIGFLIYKALPYAFSVTKVTPPPGTLRVEVTYDGETWRFGPDDADNVITGDALEFCRLGVQRMKRADTKTLEAKGPLAEVALGNLRAYL